MHMLVTFLLPKNWKEVFVGGNQVEVLFFDFSLHFDFLRLTQLLQLRLAAVLKNKTPKEKTLKLSAAEETQLLRESLARLHFVSLTDSLSLLATLRTASFLLATTPSIRVLMLDGLMEFFWLEKSKEKLNLSKASSSLFKHVCTFIEKHALVVFITLGRLFSSPSSSLLGKDYEQLVKYRLILSQKNSKTSLPKTTFTSQLFDLAALSSLAQPKLILETTFAIENHGISSK